MSSVLTRFTSLVGVLVLVVAGWAGAQTSQPEPPPPPVIGVPDFDFELPGPGGAVGGVPPGGSGATDGGGERLGVLSDELSEVQGEIERLLADEAREAVALPDGWPNLFETGVEAPIRTVVQPADRPIRVLLQPLSVTTLHFSSDERIVDCVVGDSVYFEVQCADNLVYVKGMVEFRRTRLTVSTVRDRLYAFDLFVIEALPPDHILRIAWPGDDVPDSMAGAPVPAVSASSAVATAAAFGITPGPRVGEREPGFGLGPLSLSFEPAQRVASLRAEIAAAENELAALSQQGADEMIRMQTLRDERLAEYLQAYPVRVEPRYRLTQAIQGPPLYVSQIWTDGRFTYLRSHSEESPAIYELSGSDGGEELLVNYQLSPEGLYVVNHVMSAGYAQLHGTRGEWHLWEVPPLRVINSLNPGDLPTFAPDWRRTKSQRSWFVRHNRLTLLIAAVGGAYTGLGFLNKGDGAFCWKFVC